MDNLKIAVIGAGHWGPNLIRNFLNDTRCNLTWICDSNTDRATALAKHYAGARIKTNAQEVLLDPNTDAVAICTPTVTHFELVKTALEAGKHVFVEKPLTTNSVSSAKLAELADSKNLTLMVGHVFLFNAAIQRMKQLIEAGEIGQVFYASCIRTNLGPIRGDVNALWDLAPHDISTLLFLLGEYPIQCSAFGQSFINAKNEDVVLGQIGFPSGAFASVHVSWLDPRKVRQTIVVGSKKMLVFDDLATNKLTLVDRGIEEAASGQQINDTIQLFRKSIREGSSTAIDLPLEEPLKNECTAFVKEVLDGEKNPSNAWFGVEVVKVLERMQMEMNLRKWTGPT